PPTPPAATWTNRCRSPTGRSWTGSPPPSGQPSRSSPPGSPAAAGCHWNRPGPGWTGTGPEENPRSPGSGLLRHVDVHHDAGAEALDVGQLQVGRIEARALEQ